MGIQDSYSFGTFHAPSILGTGNVVQAFDVRLQSFDDLTVITSDDLLLDAPDVSQFSRITESGIRVGVGRFTFTPREPILPTSHTTQVPEPPSIALFGIGLAGLGLMGWRTRRKPQRHLLA